MKKTDHTQKELIIVGGPNGAGKTTFVQETFPGYIKDSLFLNADIIAQNLSPQHLESVNIQSGKELLRALDNKLKETKSFIIESTLSGRHLLRKIKEAHDNGFLVKLIFLWISTIELCDFRVKSRVSKGGHNIPYPIIERRYKRGLKNFNDYLSAVNEFSVYITDQTPTLIVSKSEDSPTVIHSPHLYNIFTEAVKKAWKVITTYEYLTPNPIL